MTHFPYRCPRCNATLTAHCPETNTACNWLRCTNANCTATTVDLDGGQLLTRDGTREVVA